MNAVRFVDNQAMVANSNAGLQEIIDARNKTTEDHGMKINIKTTKVIRIGKTEGKQMKINIDGNNLEEVKQYCHFGSIITEGYTCHTEIKRRIAIGKDAFAKRKELLRGKMNGTLRKE